jgi:hypothetical protein
MVERLGHRPCGRVERGLFFNKTGGEVLLRAIGFEILLNVSGWRLVFRSKISRWVPVIWDCKQREIGVALHGIL